MEMMQAWYCGDPELMQRVLHDDMAERGIYNDPVTGRSSVRQWGKAQVVEGTRRGDGILPQEQWNIEATILDATETIATVKVRSAYLVDICQLVKIDEQWKIINVLWTARRTPPWLRTTNEIRNEL